MKAVSIISNKKYWGIYFSIIFLLNSAIKLSGQSTLSPEINKVFFENSEFDKSILLEIPNESSLTQFDKISKNPDIYESGLPIATLTIGKGVEDYDKSLINFLVNNGYAKIQTTIQTIHNSRYGDNSTVYNFIFYSEQFKKFIQYYKVDEIGTTERKLFIKIGHRKLISIDYKNEYEDSPLGMKRKFYSIVFSYKLINDLPNFKVITKVFTGKGKIFLDPDDGKWKMIGSFDNLGLTLGDNKFDEYLQIIHNDYSPFDFEKNKKDCAIKNANRRDSLFVAETRAKAYNDSITYHEKFPDQVTYPDGTIYKGHLIDGKKNGYGEYTNSGGSVYEGEWKGDKKNGQGKMVYKDGSSYDGEWKDDKIEGYGTIIWANGNKYIGNLVNNQPEGQGASYYPNGNKAAEGNYKNGRFDGKLTFYYENGKISYSGDWKIGKKDGTGTLFNEDGFKLYEGEFKNDAMEGQGVYTPPPDQGPDNDVIKGVFTGEFKNGNMYNGNYINTLKDGTIYLTEFKNGVKGKSKRQ